MPNRTAETPDRPSRVVALSEAKRRLLARLAKGDDAAAGPPPIPRAPDGVPVPLSFAQERVWFVERLAPGAPLFNLVGAAMMSDPVDLDTIRRRLAGAVARHDALRTSIQMIDEVPVLAVADTADATVKVVDYSDADPASADTLATQAALRISSEPYELDKAPLWRAALVRLPAGRSALVLAAHHIVMDATSIVMLGRILGGVPDLEPATRYVDFAAWQRSPAWCETTAGEFDYWRRQLADPPPPLVLPADHARPADRSLRGRALSVDLDPALIRQVRDASRAAKATPYAVFLAAFKVLLLRYTGARDIPVACPVGGRTRPEIHSVLGMFANMVVVRSQLAGRSTFRETVVRVRDTTTAALSHQSVPFERLVSEMGASGRGTYPPLAQAGFNMPYQEAILDAPLLDLPVAPDRSELDLTAHIVPTHGRLRLQFEYATELFEEPTVRRMMDCYLTLLSGLIANPDRPIDEVPLLRPEDRALLTAGRGPGAVADEVAAAVPDRRAAGDDASVPSPPTLLVDLVAQQARDTPDGVALVCGDDTLTYAELARRAGALAHRLRERGVAPETHVGVCLRRGFDLVVALFAVWQTGAAYVPLDPDQPASRTRLILEETAPPAILTSADLLTSVLSDVLDASPRDQYRVLCVDSERDSGVDAEPPSALTPDNAAYVIYTSGSTGQPKGVVITHGGIANRVLWGVRQHGLGPDDRVLQKTRLTFDAAGWEIFAPLVSGGAVVLAPPGVEEDPDAMLRAVADHQVTVLQVVPSVLRLLAESPHWPSCRSLRLLCSAGEPLDAELCARVLDQAELRIVNTYGPTECAIDVAAVAHDPRRRSGPVPIGRPIDNIRLHVLDPAGEPAPVGVPGELHVGGAGVGRGYLNRPDLTAASFTPDPFGPPGGRLYRTGDLARWRADGLLEFLGRLDQQVKVNGVRVEPGEVEHALRSHPDVRAAAVLPWPDGFGGTALVAYVVGDVAPEALRRFVRELLPGPMAPGRYMLLDELPLTPTGKLDRAALPAPDSAGDDEADHVPPRDHAEQMVAAVWAEILDVDRVGAHDDFFARGGHSLLLTRVATRLRQLSGADVPLRRLFTAPTVVEQARLLDAGRAPDREPIQRADRAGPLPLSSGQRRLWFLDRLDPGGSQYVIPHVTRLRGELDLKAFGQALTAIVARHEVLRSRYEVRDGEPVQVVDPAGEAPVRFTDLSGAEDPRAAALNLAGEEIARPFDLATGPVLRCHVIRTAPDDHIVVLAVHHIAFDGESMAVFAQELAARYAAARDGRTPRPAAADARPPEIQYADFAAWQRAALDGTEFRDQLDYWTEQLAGLTPVELPADRPRVALGSQQGATRTFHISSDLAGDVRKLGRSARATAFMTLLAAFDVLLARHTNATHLAVGTPVAGRTQPELERLIGFVANTMVLRTDLSGDPDFRTVLERVRSTCADGFAHQDLPFEQLVDVLQPERDLSRNPLFQIMFEMGVAGAEFGLPGLSAEPPCDEIPWQTSKFDLTLGLVEQPDGSLWGYVEYATELFDAATIDRLIGHYLRILEEVTSDPDRRLSSLDILAPEERRQLLSGWNQLDPPAQTGECLHQEIARKAAETPHAPAVVQRDRTLSYAELERWANRLAHELRARGVGPETPVAVFLERSAEAVVALLGVLKAGGVHVPIDLANPDERVSLLLEDTGAQVVLTVRRFAEQLARFGVDPVAVDEPDALPPDADPPESLTASGNLAYAIYTSGSTGRPKGVMIDHAAYLSHCRVVIDRYGIGPGSRVVLLSALVFDPSMDQIGATLLAGATVVVGDPDMWAPDELADRLAAEGVTIMEITPAYYREMMAGVRPGDERLRQLRLMNVGSEVVTYDDARRWLAAGLPGEFMCNYGPTEATITCTAITVGPEEAAAGRPEQALPIGWPFRDTSAHVLDPWLNPAPVGVPGELCLGGVRLARGYLHRPDLTAASFVPDPFGPPGSRLYRTGDLVRRRPDGAIEFLGRLDNQVKIRGFRIELGEIEATLAGHPAVRASAVVASPGGTGPELAAYLVFAPGTTATPQDVRDHLRGRLPDYMVPTRWAVLDELPLTASKKVNRKALPPLDGASRLRREFVAPRTPAEEQVTQVWAGLLDVTEIGVHDDFFELGGHSLLATRAHARLQELFGVEFPLRRLFEATSAADLATLIEEVVEADIDALSDAEVVALLAQEGSP